MLIKENDFYVKESAIHGKGLFCNRDIHKGEMLSYPEFNGAHLIHEQKIIALFEHNQAARETGCRICNDIFAYVDNAFGSYHEDYINHSRKNNCAYHCGFLFAISNIPSDTELTINYEDILPGGHQLQLGNDLIIGANSALVFDRTAKILSEIFNKG